jgi:hypothetical protein
MNNNIIYIIIVFVIIYFIFNNNKNENNKQIENFAAGTSGDNNTDMVVFSDNDGNLISKDRNSVFTKGMILAWSGTISTIPSGWKLCDGANETPNLRGRFILGVNPGNNRNNALSIREMDNADGYERVTLTVPQIPPHSHKYNKNTNVCNGNCPGGSNTRFMTWENADETTVNTGGGESHENMPPFYVLAYIMKT